MPLLKTVVIAGIGVPAEYHVVRAINVDFQSKQSLVQVASFYTRPIAKQGGQSIGTASVYVDAIPAQGEDLTAFSERVVTASAPEGVDPASVPGNRYVFADAEIVASAPNTTS